MSLSDKYLSPYLLDILLPFYILAKSIRNAEDGLGFHLLTSTAGGKHGGGAVLTDEARQMLTAYDEYCEKRRAYGEKLFEETFAFYDDIPKQEVHKKEERYAR